MNTPNTTPLLHGTIPREGNSGPCFLIRDLPIGSPVSSAVCSHSSRKIYEAGQHSCLHFSSGEPTLSKLYKRWRALMLSPCDWLFWSRLCIQFYARTNMWGNTASRSRKCKDDAKSCNITPINWRNKASPIHLWGRSLHDQVREESQEKGMTAGSSPATAPEIWIFKIHQQKESIYNV